MGSAAFVLLRTWSRAHSGLFFTNDSCVSLLTFSPWWKSLSWKGADRFSLCRSLAQGPLSGCCTPAWGCSRGPHGNVIPSARPGNSRCGVCRAGTGQSGGLVSCQPRVAAKRSTGCGRWGTGHLCVPFAAGGEYTLIYTPGQRRRLRALTADPGLQPGPGQRNPGWRGQPRARCRGGRAEPGPCPVLTPETGPGCGRGAEGLRGSVPAARAGRGGRP